MDLIRRVEGVEAFALTSPLVTRSDGKKMGKSEKGALYLDPGMVSPYEFYQYWVNVPDEDVKQFFLRFTFKPPKEIEELCSPRADVNAAKRSLALEITSMVHGESAAGEAEEAAKAAFGGGESADLSGVPSMEIPASELTAGINIVDLFVRTGLCATKSDARRLVSQGGASVNRKAVPGIEHAVTAADLENGALLIRAGKKRYFRLVAK
jgi:tyrosyl-tRNA synthetase